jgi:molybdopterin synthase sulfur carrier subunit
MVNDESKSRGSGSAAAIIRVWLPSHLRTLAKIESADGEVRLAVAPPVTQRSVLDALEARYPMLRGTIRDHATQQRRAFLRFFACEEDLSLESPDAPLPEAVAGGKEPFMVIGAVAGG